MISDAHEGITKARPTPGSVPGRGGNGHRASSRRARWQAESAEEEVMAKGGELSAFVGKLRAADEPDVLRETRTVHHFRAVRAPVSTSRRISASRGDEGRCRVGGSRTPLPLAVRRPGHARPPQSRCAGGGSRARLDLESGSAPRCGGQPPAWSVSTAATAALAPWASAAPIVGSVIRLGWIRRKSGTDTPFVGPIFRSADGATASSRSCPEATSTASGNGPPAPRRLSSLPNVAAHGPPPGRGGRIG